MKVIGLRDTATNRLGGVFVVAVDNGGRFDPLARATGLAASPSLCMSTTMTSPLLDQVASLSNTIDTKIYCIQCPWQTLKIGRQGKWYPQHLFRES